MIQGGVPFFIGTVPIPDRVIMAPLAGITNGPFRRIAAKVGCRVFWTEMISAEGLVRDRNEMRRLLPDPDEAHPVVVQIFGADPSVMAEAAGADVLDINMACPVRRLTGAGAGAILMRDPVRVAAIVGAVARRVGIPVTLKIRAGWDDREMSAPEIVRAAAGEGARAVSIHGRTRVQGFSGRADHAMAARLVTEAGIPVIVSGDIASGEDAVRVLAETGAAAVMVGRAAVGNPWIFGLVSAQVGGQADPVHPASDARHSLILEHLDLMVKKFGEKKGLGLLRPHLAGYVKGRPDAAAWRRALMTERSAARLRDLIRGAFTDSG
jgi:tRNA-dihydrouridine synthase B